jgi:hypothetical protein
VHKRRLHQPPTQSGQLLSGKMAHVSRRAVSGRIVPKKEAHSDMCKKLIHRCHAKKLIPGHVQEVDPTMQGSPGLCLLNRPPVHALCLLKHMPILKPTLPVPLHTPSLPSSPPILMFSESPPQTLLGPEMFGPLSPSFLDQPPFGPGGYSAGHMNQPAETLGGWPAEGSEVATAGLQFMPDITCVLCSSPIRAMLIPCSAISLPYSTTRSRTHICTRRFRRQGAARPT